MFKRFGEIIVINTLVSIILTLTVLPVLLAYWGPTGAQRLFLLFSQILVYHSVYSISFVVGQVHLMPTSPDNLHLQSIMDRTKDR